MNSFLLSLGIAVALILVGAFAAPFFIDWSSFRSYFEARTGELIGRPVAFEGDLTVRLVPFPSLVADNVRIGETGSGEGVERIALGAALAPLLSGELEVTDLTLTRPHAVIHVDPTGRLSWGIGEPSPPVDPDRIAISRFEIADGSFTVDDERSGRQFELAEVNLSGSATSLLGPFKAEGGAVLDGERYTVRVATGRVTGDGTGMRLKASILPAARPIAIDLDGALLRIEGTPTFDGRLVVERPAEEEGDTAAWRLEGLLTASPEVLVLEGMSVRLGTESRNVSLSGAANVRLGADPRFDAVVSARQIDLDRAFGAGPDSPVTPQAAVARLGGLLDPAIFPLPGHLALDVESTVISGGLLEGLSIDLDVDGSTWSLDRATVTAPGHSSVAVAGTVGLNGPSPIFEGAARLATEQATVFANWVFGPQARLPGFAIPAGSLTASGQVRIDAAGIAFDRVDMHSGQSEMQGALAYRTPADDGRAGISLALTADRLDPLQAGATKLGSEANLLGAIEALLSGIDVEVELEVGSLSLGAIEAQDVTVAGMVADGDIRFEELVIGDIGGARLSGAGEILGYANSPDGSFRLDASARSLDGVVAALTALGAPATAAALGERAPALVPADVVVSLAAARTNRGSRGEVSASGTLGGSALDARFGFEGRIDDIGAAGIELSVEARNDDGAALARQLGLAMPQAVAAPGHIDLAATGSPQEGMSFTMETTGIGLDGQVSGAARFPADGAREVAADATLNIADARVLAGLAGIVLPGEAVLPLQVKTTVSGTGDLWRLPALDVAQGDVAVSGSLTVDSGTRERVVGGTLEADRVALGWLAATLLGQQSVSFPEVPYGEPAWPAAAFTPFGRGGWRGRIELKTPEFALFDGWTVTGATTAVTFDETRLSLDGLTGGLFGGQLTADIDLAETDGLVDLTGRVDLSGARLEEIVWKESGRAVATGEISAGIEFGGRGRSPSAIVASLSGTGSFTVSDGILRRLNPSAFEQIVSAADAGLDLTEDKVLQTFAGHLDSGSLRFQSMEGAFSISSGVLRASNIRIDTEALESFASATVDLPVLGLDSEWSLQVEAAAEGGRTREVGVVFAGPLAAPSRQIDVNPLLGYLTVRAFEQEVERLEKLQADILEKERLSRELVRQGQERVRREREEEQRQDDTARAEAERRAQEEAARAAAEAEAQRLAEEEKRRAEEEAQQAEAERQAQEAARAAAEEERRRAEEEERRRAEEERLRQEDLARQRAAGQPAAEPSAAEPDAAQAPQPEPQGGSVGTFDNDDLKRRIEDILREIPSARDGLLPDSGVTTGGELPPPLGAGAAPAQATTVGPAPPLSAPLIISPQPVAPVIERPRTTVDTRRSGPPRRTDSPGAPYRTYR